MANRSFKFVKAFDYYMKNTKNWDTLKVFPKVTWKPSENDGDGVLKGEFTVTDDICNIVDTLHGGYTSSIIDMFCVFGACIHPKGNAAWTTDMNVIYLSAAKLGDKVNVECKPIKMSKSRIVMECSLVNSRNGAPVARGSLGFLAAPEVDLTPKLPYNQNIE